MAERTCSVPDCDRRHLARGYCNAHYIRWKKHGDPTVGERRRNFCTMSDCDAPVVGRGWCEKHYTRWKRYGDPTATKLIRGDVVARFESYLTLGQSPAHAPHLGPCWLWTAGLDPDGYGCFNADGMQSAHRWSYVHHVGPIPEGLELDHLCRVRACVNAWHLDPVTRLVNVLRAAEVRYGDQPRDAAAAEATA